MRKTAYNRQGVPIYSCPTSKAYKENFEKIFGKKKVKPKND